jgi:hypothetical protein
MSYGGQLSSASAREARRRSAGPRTWPDLAPDEDRAAAIQKL